MEILLFVLAIVSAIAGMWGIDYLQKKLNNGKREDNVIEDNPPPPTNELGDIEQDLDEIMDDTEEIANDTTKAIFKPIVGSIKLIGKVSKKALKLITFWKK